MRDAATEIGDTGLVERLAGVGEEGSRAPSDSTVVAELTYELPKSTDTDILLASMPTVAARSICKFNPDTNAQVVRVALASCSRHHRSGRYIPIEPSAPTDASKRSEGVARVT